MTPATQMLLRQLQDDGRADEQAMPSFMQEEPQDYDPPEVREFKMKLKKRHYRGLLKKQLEDAGYEDLARIITIREG